MHKQSRVKASIMTILLMLTMALAVASPALGSTGNMHINVSSTPSPILQVRLGTTMVNLSFHDVTFSGGQCKLYLSADGLASLSEDDIPYGPTFSIADIQGATPVTRDGYTVGNYWINGTIPTTMNVPGGNYYVKGFDGSTAAVAVTDNYLTILATFKVVAVWDDSVDPAWGAGQTMIELRVFGLPANNHANFSYTYGSTTTIANLVPGDENGRLTYAMIAPDLGQAVTPAGELPEAWATITFTMIVDETGQTETDTFNEYARGLIQLSGSTSEMAATGNLFGNLTDFGVTPTGLVSNVQVTVLGSLRIAGNYFHPGTVDIFLDSTHIGTGAANQTGFFNTTVSIPITSIGDHNITLDDGKIVFIITIEIIPTLLLSPTSGPVGTVVTATGYGYPASDGTRYNVTIWWDFTCNCYECPSIPVNLTMVPTNTNGYFMITFVVPNTVGGSHTVTGEADDMASTSATATFTVTPTLVVTPLVINNNGTKITVIGTGLASWSMMEGDWYDLCIDYEKDFDVYANCTGAFEFEIIVTKGFEQGVHVVSLYNFVSTSSSQGWSLNTYALFTVTGEDRTDEILAAIDEVSVSLSDLHEYVSGSITGIPSLQSALNGIESDLSSARSAILAEVAGMGGQLTSIESYAQNAATKATEAATSAGNAATAASAAESAAVAAQSSGSGISTAVYGAILLSLVAAVASIIAVITLQRKVA